MNFAKFLTTPFLQNKSGRLLLPLQESARSFEKIQFDTSILLVENGRSSVVPDTED